MADLTLTDVAKSYGDVQVLRNIDLEIRSGEFIVFVGPSGCGKSTLLRMIAGLERISGGTLEIDGQRMNDIPPSQRGIAMVFQSYALYPHMTVRDNMAFALKIAGKSRAEVQEATDRAGRMLQLTPYLDRLPKALSGGQRQRVALGRAMAIKPRVLLLDEPFGALDAQVRRDLRRWLRSVHDSTGTTTIFVTHDQEEAFELANRVVVMNGGVIEQTGQPDEIYDHPATPFVARFLGLTVELPVTMRAGRALAPGLDLAALPRRALPDGPATLFLRPADIQPVPDASAPFRVTEIATTGALLRIVAENSPGCRIEAEVPRRDARELRKGQAVALRVVAGQIFPGGAPQTDLPIQTPMLFKEARP